jgi:hypothetical protein
MRKQKGTKNGGETGQDDDQHGIRISPVSRPVSFQILCENFPELFQFFRRIIAGFFEIVPCHDLLSLN